MRAVLVMRSSLFLVWAYKAEFLKSLNAWQMMINGSNSSLKFCNFDTATLRSLTGLIFFNLFVYLSSSFHLIHLQSRARNKTELFYYKYITAFNGRQGEFFKIYHNCFNR